METTNNIRILMVEDQPICRLGISMSLADSHIGCELVGVAENVQQALAFLDEHGNDIDVILLDYVLPDGTGMDVIEAAKRISPKAKIVILSGEAGGATIKQLMEKGINGFMSKNIQPEALSIVLGSVMQGNDYLGEGNMLIERSVKADMDDLNALTRREMEIITLCAAGMSAKQIADELNITTHTVENHKDNIFKKLKVKSISELILYAFRVGLIS